MFFVQDHPWLARLSSSTSSDDKFCSGALLYRQWVITTASCVKNRNASDMVVILGDHTETVDRLVRLAVKNNSLRLFL